MPTVSVTWGIMLLLIGLLVAITQVSSQLLNSTLHSTLHGVPIAYINERAVFTCVVNSNSMAWTSEEYIGAGGQRIPFSSANDVGHTESAINNNQTVAVLVNSTESDTDVVITSELYIRVESTHQLASVKCVNSGDNTDTSIEFLLADIVQITCDRMSACPGDVITCNCATGSSTSLAWTINRTRLTFGSNDPLLMQQDVPGSSTFAVLTENSDVNGIRVIMSNLTASFSNDRIILTCENVDHAMLKSIILPVAQNCHMPSPTHEVTTPLDQGNRTTTPAQSSCTCSCAGPIASAVVIGAIFAVILAIIVIIVACRCKKLHKSQLRRSEAQLKCFEAPPEEKKKDEVDAVRRTVKGSGDLKSQNLMEVHNIQCHVETGEAEANLDVKIVDNQNDNEIKESENEKPEKTWWDTLGLNYLYSPS